MNVFEFGDAKLRLKDIDPLYWAVHAMPWSQEQKCAYTLAFVSFDLAGLAGDIMDQSQTMRGYWKAMHEAAEQALRGAPRRYFRGQAAHGAIEWLQHKYKTPVAALGALGGSFAEAEAAMKHWPQFGPTAIFKLCDMAERVCGVPVSFADVTTKQLMSNDMVTKGVEKAVDELGLGFGEIAYEGLFHKMRKYKWATKAGPGYDRKLNMQEFETILCYYSHDDGNNKHLPGMDVENIRAELAGWGTTAAMLIERLPNVRRR